MAASTTNKATEYTEKLDKFVEMLNSGQNGKWTIETGRKFDKVYEVLKNGNKSGRYMVDRNSWVVYGIKSWAQINPRRTYGTLDTTSQYDWTGHTGAPRAGTDAEMLHNELEAQITAGYKKRGRPKKVKP